MTTKRDTMKTQKVNQALALDGEASGGGDYLVVREVGPGQVYLEVGHQCVTFLHQVVPVEFLTFAIVAALGDNVDARAFLEARLEHFMPEYQQRVLALVGDNTGGKGQP